MPHAYDRRTALVVVDVQNDFADPSGSLYVTGGEEVVAGINDEIAAARDADGTVVFTQDWHPETTPHFVDDGGVWPVHCVKGTWGAQLHPDLSTDADAVVRKGTGGEDGYSAFSMRDPETEDETPTGLEGYLRGRGVESVVVVGIASDVCVLATALDAQRAGFTTTTLWSLTRAVEMNDGDTAAARTELVDAGVDVIGELG